MMPPSHVPIGHDCLTAAGQRALVVFRPQNPVRLVCRQRCAWSAVTTTITEKCVCSVCVCVCVCVCVAVPRALFHRRSALQGCGRRRRISSRRSDSAFSSKEVRSSIMPFSRILAMRVQVRGNRHRHRHLPASHSPIRLFPLQFLRLSPCAPPLPPPFAPTR